jgi:hypothetical protein
MRALAAQQQAGQQKAGKGTGKIGLQAIHNDEI